jgi:hypothetical protein
MFGSRKKSVLTVRAMQGDSQARHQLETMLQRGNWMHLCPAQVKQHFNGSVPLSPVVQPSHVWKLRQPLVLTESCCGIL